jgi:selT/selW/selH-like putative selenoprotein
LTAAIQKKFGSSVKVESVRGDGGIFDVEIDDTLVFRKFEEGRFPTNREILAEISTRLNGK